MAGEVVTLASAGAGTLTTLMVTDGWARVKDGFAALFGRHGDGEAVTKELEASRGQLLAAQAAGDVQSAADVQAEWRARLRRLLEQHPDAVPVLTELIDRFATPAPTVTTEIHHNVYLGPTAHNTGSGDQHNTFGGGTQ